MGKGEIAHYEQFFLFPQCFLSSWRIVCHFHQIWNCSLQTLSFSLEESKICCLERVKSSCLVVLGFNATLGAKVISWWSVMHMCSLAFSHQYLYNFPFQSHQLLFSHASAEVRGENTPERKFSSTGDQTQNHQVMSLTCSPLSSPARAGIRVKCG